MKVQLNFEDAKYISSKVDNDQIRMTIRGDLLYTEKGEHLPILSYTKDVIR